MHVDELTETVKLLHFDLRCNFPIYINPKYDLWHESCIHWANFVSDKNWNFQLSMFAIRKLLLTQRVWSGKHTTLERYGLLK